MLLSKYTYVCSLYYLHACTSTDRLSKLYVEQLADVTSERYLQWSSTSNGPMRTQQTLMKAHLAKVVTNVQRQQEHLTLKQDQVLSRCVLEPQSKTPLSSPMTPGLHLNSTFVSTSPSHHQYLFRGCHHRLSIKQCKKQLPLNRCYSFRA